MRTYQYLDSAEVENNIMTFSSSATQAVTAHLSFAREGAHLLLSASFGALEIALRVRYEEFARDVANLHAVEGLSVTRQVGTGQAFIGLGLTSEYNLIIRPTLVSDAHGHLTVNLVITRQAYEQLYGWLGLEEKARQSRVLKFDEK